MNRFEDELFLFNFFPLLFTYSFSVLIKGSIYVYYIVYEGFIARGMGVIFFVFAIYIFNSVYNGFADCMGNDFKEKSFYKILIKSFFFYSLLCTSIFIIISTIIEFDFISYLIIYICLLFLSL